MEEKKVNENINKKKSSSKNNNNNSKKKNNIKKMNLNMNNAQDETVLDLYNTKLKKINIITTIVMLVIYVISFITTFAGIGAKAPTNVETVMSQIQNMLAFSAVVILAGVVPYCYLSFLGVIQIITLMNDFGIRYTYGISSAPALFIGGIITCIGISICMSAGFYLCYLTTKKRKYYNASQFSMDDVKMQLYQMRDNKEKIEQMEKKQQEKAKKAEENNIKIPYLKISIIGVVGYVIEMIGLFISKI